MLRILINAPLAPAAMFVGSLVGFGYVFVQAVLVAIASRWPTVEGEITEAYLIQRGAGFDARGLNERVVYRYIVDGQLFVNDRVRFGPQPQRASVVPATGHPVAKSVVAQRDPVGKRVLVRYNPRDPRRSVLHAQPNVAVFVIAAVAAVTLFVGARRLFWPL